MSVKMALRGHGVPDGGHRAGNHLIARTAVGATRMLGILPPRLIRVCLAVLRRGTHPASTRTAETARRAVVGVSPAAAGASGCLIWFLATVLACRVRSEWPTWGVGVRAEPPFGAHTTQTYHQLITIGSRAGEER